MTTNDNMNNPPAELDYSAREAIINDLDRQLRVDWNEGLKSLRSYDADSEDLRRDILALAWRFALGSSDTLVRQELVHYLLDTVLNGTLFLQGQAIRFLMDFSPPDFDVRAAKKLTALPWSGEYGSEIIRLIGSADIRSRVPEIHVESGSTWKHVDSHTFYASPQWAATLVLSRFGDINSTKRVCDRVEKEPDIVVRATKLFRDLAYTKQPHAFNLLRSFLHSKNRLPQLKDSVPGELEAKYAAAQFAEHVNGCPVLGPDVYEKDIQAIRNWADEQTVFEIRR